jgi:putative Mg2+ transporter-C (MgtC) family protein
VPGIQREHVGTAAGLRTHILVALGAAMFVIVSLDMDASPDATTRVLQGIATGIGFVGAGTILKANDERHIHGLTSASSIWLTAALGSAAGAGRIWPAFAGAVMALITLSTLRRFESRVRPPEVPPPAQTF